MDSRDGISLKFVVFAILALILAWGCYELYYINKPDTALFDMEEYVVRHTNRKNDSFSDPLWVGTLGKTMFYHIHNVDEIQAVMDSYNDYISDHPFYASHLPVHTFEFYYGPYYEDHERSQLIVAIEVHDGERYEGEIDPTLMYDFR